MGITSRMKRKPRTVEEMRFSKTSLTDFEATTTCPRRWKGQHLDFEVTFEATEPMVRGLYFEQQAIGKSVDGEEDIEWPGFKGKLYDRANKQADKFKKTMKDEDWQITDIQVKAENDRIKGVWDIQALDAFERPNITDLKFTRDINGRPPYSYAHLDQMDHVQLAMYKALGKETQGIDFAMYYYVADYSPREKVIFPKMKITQREIDDMYRRVDEAFDIIQYWDSHEYPLKPSKRECERCNLECNARFTE